MAKAVKNAAELTYMLMVELRKHPECNAITRIGITRPVTKNWGITTQYDRAKFSPEGFKILMATVQRLQALYDLADKN